MIADDRQGSDSDLEARQRDALVDAEPLLPEADAVPIPELTAPVQAIERSLADGTDPQPASAALDELTRRSDPLLPALDALSSTTPWIGVAPPTRYQAGVYGPTDAPPGAVSPQRRYWYESAVWLRNGYATASKATGKLSAYSIAAVDRTLELASAQVAIRVVADRATYGRRSRVRLEPQTSWAAQGKLHLAFPGPVAGSIQVVGRLVLTVRVWDDAAGRWDRHAVATTKFPLFIHSATEGTTYPFSGQGLLPPDTGRLDFTVESPRTYLIGVMIQSQTTHSLTSSTGGPLPPPAAGDFQTYALVMADVPRMKLSHTVLAW